VALEQGPRGAEQGEVGVRELRIDLLSGVPAADRRTLVAGAGVGQRFQGERGRRQAWILLHIAGQHEKLLPGQLLGFLPFPGGQQVHDLCLLAHQRLHAAEEGAGRLGLGLLRRLLRPRGEGSQK
jgi:hypothetical protein